MLLLARRIAFSLAGPACPAAIRSHPRVLWRELVTMIAMGRTLARLSVFLHDARDRIFMRPAALEAFQDGRMSEAGQFRPFGDSQTQAASRDDDVVAGVPLLLPRRGPAAVVREVSAFVVDALDRVRATWTRPHVRHEILEIEPELADPEFRVALKRPMLRVRSSADHRLPSPVRRARAASLHRFSYASQPHVCDSTTGG